MRNLVMGCAVAALVALSATSEARPPATFEPLRQLRLVPLVKTQFGVATWYGAESQGTTATGEPYDMNGMTAAHKTLPLESRIRVINLRNNKSVVLRVNDRGPNVPGRLLDVSRAAAERLGFTAWGKTPVQITVLHYPHGHVAQPGQFAFLACARPAK